MTRTARPRPAPAASSNVAPSGRALLQDMDAYRKKVSATPAAARDFLRRVGVLTASGKPKRLIRG